MVKPDTSQIEATATAFGMDGPARRRFGDFIEDSKHAGDWGTGNRRGDFTRAELQEKAREFLELQGDA